MIVEYDSPTQSRMSDQSMKQKCQQLEDDLKRTNTDLIQYKDRTQALQKQVNGLKSGKYKPDQVPEFKTQNPSQQIIKALIKENEELNTRIELMKEIKEKVKTNAANKDPSDLFDALTYLEEENKTLRTQLNLGDDPSPHSLLGNENVEVNQLKEKLRVSLNKSRDLTEHLDSLKKDLDRNKTLLDEKTYECQRLESRLPQLRTPPSSRPAIEKDPMANVIPRDVNPNPNPIPYHYPRPERSPVRHPDAISNMPPHHHINHQPSPVRPDYFIRMPSAPLPPSVIVHPNLSPGSPAMPPGTPGMAPGSPALPHGSAAMYPKDPQKYPGSHLYKQNDYGYK